MATTTPRLRPELEELPSRLTRLYVHRGYPVPWFVEWIKDGQATRIGEGVPDFRVMSGARLIKAIKERRCWVCGSTIHSSHSTFAVGPMCTVNRTSAEPPSHRECAEWSARNCPFLSRPHARRRDAGMPVKGEVPGVMIERNPGVAAVWTNRTFETYRPPKGGILFALGEPSSVSWWCGGRPATREECLESIRTGLPALQEYVDSPEAQAELDEGVRLAMGWLPE